MKTVGIAKVEKVQTTGMINSNLEYFMVLI